MSIAENLKGVQQDLPEGVRLVAVSKFHPVEALNEAYAAGQRVFGESRVQEMCAKQEVMPADVEWHFIGHLQTNKIKYMLPFVSLIHGIDSYRLLEEVNKQAASTGRVINCLLQLYIAQEETKFGFSPEECRSMPRRSAKMEKPDERAVCGLMAWRATRTNGEQNMPGVSFFCTGSSTRSKRSSFAEFRSSRSCPMGMSHELPPAVAEGSTLVRVGSRHLRGTVY